MIFSDRLIPFFVLGLLIACGPRNGAEENASDLRVAGRRVGGFKGLGEIEIILNERLSSAGNKIQMSYLLGPALNALLGAFTEGTTTSQFEAAAPNPVNVLLWDILMEKTAGQISQFSTGNYLDEGITRAMGEIEKSPVDADASTSLRDIWQVVMRYDAPESEREAWLTAIQQPDTDWRKAEGRYRTQAVLQSLFMHPYFLLEH